MCAPDGGRHDRHHVVQLGTIPHPILFLLAVLQPGSFSSLLVGLVRLVRGRGSISFCARTASAVAVDAAGAVHKPAHAAAGAVAVEVVGANGFGFFRFCLWPRIRRPAAGRRRGVRESALFAARTLAQEKVLADALGGGGRRRSCRQNLGGGRGRVREPTLPPAGAFSREKMLAYLCGHFGGSGARPGRNRRRHSFGSVRERRQNCPGARPVSASHSLSFVTEIY